MKFSPSVFPWLDLPNIVISDWFERSTVYDRDIQQHPAPLFQVPTFHHRRRLVSMNPAQVVSIHFPKAAGTSLHVQLVKLLGNFDMGRFQFIGFYEKRATDIPRLGQDLGLPLVAAVCENRTDRSIERLELEADLSVRRRPTDLLASNVAFYERQLH
jgi:hypothetical protein